MRVVKASVQKLGNGSIKTINETKIHLPSVFKLQLHQCSELLPPHNVIKEY